MSSKMLQINVSQWQADADPVKNGLVDNVIVITPDTGKGPFPVVFFFHGQSESQRPDGKTDKGTSTWLNSWFLGPITKGTFIPHGTLADGTNVPFAVVAIQDRGNWSANAVQTQYVIKALETMGLPLDLKTIVLTGLSAGGDATVTLAMLNDDMASRVKLIVPLSSAGFVTPPYNADGWARIKKFNIPVRSWCGAADGDHLYFSQWLDRDLKTVGADVITIYPPGVGHGSWDTIYNNSVKFQSTAVQQLGFWDLAAYYVSQATTVPVTPTNPVDPTQPVNKTITVEITDTVAQVIVVNKDYTTKNLL